MEFTMEGLYAIASRFGPNLMSALTSMTLSELHRFLGYRVEDEVSPKAQGAIADTLHTVQRPLAKQRQARIAEYQENTLLAPLPLNQSKEQGYQPAITLTANRPLSVKAVPGVATLMGMAYVLVSKNNDTMVVVSDGVGRVSGLELLERKYQQKTGPPEFRQKRIELESLRIPVLILFPISGELSKAHMQQALYDQNVLATPLQPAQALTMDHRSPYNAVFRGMFEGDSERYGLQKFGVNWQAKTYGPKIRDFFVAAPMVKFIKIATEGPRFAESARGAGRSLKVDQVPETSRNLALFWSIIIQSAQQHDPKQFTPGTVKDNMAITGPGLTALGLLAHELFRSERGKQMTPDARLEAIESVGRRDWSRKNPEWQRLGIVEHLEENGKPTRFVLRGAGASSARALTSHLLDIASKRLQEPVTAA